jgi:hypothetical protein
MNCVQRKPMSVWKNDPKSNPSHFFVEIYEQLFTVENKQPGNSGYFWIFQNNSLENNRPTGENSPNLVTLIVRV